MRASGSRASCCPVAQSRISVALVLSHRLCRPLLSPDHLSTCNTLCLILCLFSAFYFGLELHCLQGEGRAAAPISCGEWAWPQPGSRASLWWATEEQESGEYANFALNRQRRSSRVLALKFQAENARSDMLNGCKREFFQQILGLRIFPR